MRLREPNTRSEFPAFQQELLVLQRRLLSEIPVSNIASGSYFPLERVIECLPPRFTLIDFGTGKGVKTLEMVDLSQRHEKGGTIVGVDINPQAVGRLSQKAAEANLPVQCFCQDATSLAFPDSWADGVTAFGLFCNLIGEDAGKGAQQLARVLKPRGLVFLSDCLRLDESLAFLLFQETRSLEEVVKLQRQWQYRYEENAKLGLPFGTFLVFQMGHKHKEYSEKEKLQGLYHDPSVFERFARHWQKRELIELFNQEGCDIEWLQPQIFRSRTDELLLGISMIFRKR